MNGSYTREYVKAALRDEAEPLWFPRLVGPGAQVAWDRLWQEAGLGPDSYSSTRLLLRDPQAEHHIAGWCRPRSERGGGNGVDAVPIEVLATDVAQRMVNGDVRSMDALSMASRLDDAFSVLDLVPTVWSTVRQLVRALHTIDPGGDETDVSSSDPSVPFSIFVSVPPTPSEIATLRVAEAILHEAMHLHLTLIGQIVPLVQPKGKMRYSPWRGEERDSEGILQALYVFSVIRSFFAMVPTPRPDEASEYVLDRIKQIESQIRQAGDFRECEELTPEGAALVARLLDIFE